MNKKEIEEERLNYLQNRSDILIDFDNSLIEVQKEKPSVGGKICGMDYKQMSLAQIFYIIREQEEYCDPQNIASQSPWIDIKEEQKILKQLIKKAKKVFGKEYSNLYNEYKGK